MKLPFYALAVLALALGVSSCGFGYRPLDAYNRGQSDGQLDRVRGLTHNPHINDPAILPSAHRNEYVWGYCEGYKGGYYGSSGCK